jgi:glutathione S-transferase
MPTAQVLRIERTYDAPAASVFDAWTSEAVLRRWFHAQRDWTTSEASVDLRIGGAVRVVMHDPDKGEDHGGGGHYTEVDPPSRLAFTWTWDGDDRETLIEIDFEESGDATTVSFTHSNLRDEAARIDHEGGWSRCFDNLERALAEARG